MSQAAQVVPARQYSMFAWWYALQSLVFWGSVRLCSQAILRISILPNIVMLIFSGLSAVYRYKHSKSYRQYSKLTNSNINGHFLPAMQTYGKSF